MGVIEATDLRVRYPTRRQPALAGLDARVGAGERVLLAGPSGSGKSTVALCLNGLIPHSLAAEVRGRLLIAGQETRTARPEQVAQTVGLLFQDPTSQFTMLTVEDEVAFGLENLGVPRAAMEARIAASLTAVGLLGHRQRRLDRLSGGQQQRVALATLLAMEPAVLVLDEPTAHLDPVTARHLHGLLADLATTGRTLIVIEHNLEPLLPTLERVLALDADGRVLADGAARAVLTERAADLAAAGIWLPAAVRLARGLAARGASLATRPLTLAEGAAALAASPAAAVLLGAPVPPPPIPLTDPTAATRSADLGQRAPVALRARGLSWAYPGGPPVLRAVTAEVPAGGFTAIVGENGAGKTTLALLLAGLLPPPAGRVTVDGRDLARLTPLEVAGLVGFVFQNPEHQFVADTVRDEVAFGPRARRVPPAAVAEVVAGLLAEFGLAALAAANPFSLSRGQQRRLSVAAMLAAAPAALVLDEPTFGQDAAQAARLLARLERLRAAGTTVAVVTHDLGLVAEHATHVIALRTGQIVYEGAPAGLLDDPALLTSIGQVVPPLPDLLAQARALGATVPRWTRWRDILAAEAGIASGEHAGVAP